MRATVVTPTTATTRHIMMMKYGYARANLGITSPPPRPAGWDRFPSGQLSSLSGIRSGFRPPRAPPPPIPREPQRGFFPAIPISLSALRGCSLGSPPERFPRWHPSPVPLLPAVRSRCPGCREGLQPPVRTFPEEAGHRRFENRFPFPLFGSADRASPQSATP